MAKTSDTDYHRDIDAPGRSDLVEQVAEKIKELGVEYIYYQYLSITGRIMGKAVPARHWRTQAIKGVQTWMGGVTNCFPSISGQMIGFTADRMESLNIPDPETFCQLPWEKSIARVFCTLYYSLEDPDYPGMYFEHDTRGNLKRFDREFREKFDGRYLKLGAEPEMLWLRESSESRTGFEGTTRPWSYHIDQFEQLRHVWTQVYRYSIAMGLDIIQGDHEDAPGQIELNFMFDDVLRTCDRLTTYRQICAEVARQNGLIACFMTKPYMGVSANGCHHNGSIWSGGNRTVEDLVDEPLPGMEEVFTYSKGGTNEFQGEADTWRPSPLGHQVLGGMITHLNALTCLGCSTVNSYRRLNDKGLWAPISSSWGLQNRSCAIRVSSPDRFEFRAVDSLVNPYLLNCGLLKAMADGIENDLDPGEPESRNILDVVEAGEHVEMIPLNLMDALESLKKDEVVRSALPGDLYRVFDVYKRDEWESFMGQVTQWDIDRYLHSLP